MKPIYLDHNASTYIDQEVKSYLIDYLDEPLNPSSLHSLGRKAKGLLYQAKEEIARYFNISDEEIVFTSSGTESLNMLIKGLYPNHGKILTSKIEHPCVLETIGSMQKNKTPVVYARVNEEGCPQISDIEKILNQENISLMVFSAVYSETGAKIDLQALAALAEATNTLLVVDGVALLGKEVFTLFDGISGMGFSSHKIHGPKGVGLSIIRRPLPFNPITFGGPQEYGKRAGTENISGILGFTKALTLLSRHLPDATTHMNQLKDYFEKYLIKNAQAKVNATGNRICNTSNLYFENIDGEDLLFLLDQNNIYASLGSACSSGGLEPSKVLMNMGYDKKRAKSSLRFSFCRNTTFEEIERAAKTIAALMNRQTSSIRLH